MVRDTECDSPLAIFCIPTHFVAAPLSYFVSPHTLWGIHYLALYRYPGGGIRFDKSGKDTVKLCWFFAPSTTLWIWKTRTYPYSHGTTCVGGPSEQKAG